MIMDCSGELIGAHTEEVRRNTVRTRATSSRMEPTTDLNPIETGQHEVENDEVGTQSSGDFESNESIALNRDLEAFAAHTVGNRAGDRRIVLHHQDALH